MKSLLKKNSETSPAFKIVDDKVFETEKQRLLGYVRKTQELGELYFDGRGSIRLGHLVKHNGITCLPSI